MDRVNYSHFRNSFFGAKHIKVIVVNEDKLTGAFDTILTDLEQSKLKKKKKQSQTINFRKYQMCDFYFQPTKHFSS